MSRYAFLQGIHPPTAMPNDMETSPQAVGLGMKFALTAARKKNSTAIPKKILPTVNSLIGDSAVSMYDRQHPGLRLVPKDLRGEHWIPRNQRTSAGAARTPTAGACRVPSA